MPKKHKSALLMPAPRRSARRRSVAIRQPWFLENGDRLTSVEFLRRYEADDDLKKAQLIEGIVHMPSRVRADTHAGPHGLILGWLGTYSLDHPKLEMYPNATLLLDPDNAPQPDAILCTVPRPGGKVWINAKGYLCGAPEFVCEVAASSASVDLHDKFHAYRRNGIQEYLVWLTLEKRVRWFHLTDQEYVEQKERAGRLISQIFPGLVLDVRALLKGDKAKVIAALRGAKSEKLIRARVKLFATLVDVPQDFVHIAKPCPSVSVIRIQFQRALIAFLGLRVTFLSKKVAAQIEQRLINAAFGTFHSPTRKFPGPLNIPGGESDGAGKN